MPPPPLAVRVTVPSEQMEVPVPELEVMVGVVTGEQNVKPDWVKTEPVAVVIEIDPVDPLPTIAFIVLPSAEIIIALAGLPPKLTAVDPVRFVPVIVTNWPVLAVVGLKEVKVAPINKPAKGFPASKFPFFSKEKIPFSKMEISFGEFWEISSG